jgi:hypothetical protein
VDTVWATKRMWPTGKASLESWKMALWTLSAPYMIGALSDSTNGTEDIAHIVPCPPMWSLFFSNRELATRILFKCIYVELRSPPTRIPAGGCRPCIVARVASSTAVTFISLNLFLCVALPGSFRWPWPSTVFMLATTKSPPHIWPCAATCAAGRGGRWYASVRAAHNHTANAAPSHDCSLPTLPCRCSIAIVCHHIAITWPSRCRHVDVTLQFHCHWIPVKLPSY